MHLRPKQAQLLTDTLRVSYIMKNEDTREHDVALRVMIDTYIGDTDGVPFYAPGREGLITGPESLVGAKVPQYLFALQGNAQQPGIVVKIETYFPSHWRVPTEYFPTGCDSRVGPKLMRNMNTQTNTKLSDFTNKPTKDDNDKRLLRYIIPIEEIRFLQVRRQRRLLLMASGHWIGVMS